MRHDGTNLTDQQRHASTGKILEERNPNDGYIVVQNPKSVQDNDNGTQSGPASPHS